MKKDIRAKEDITVQIGTMEVPATGVLGVRQIDETHVEIKYAGPAVVVEGTSSAVLRKLREAALGREPTDSA